LIIKSEERKFMNITLVIPQEIDSIMALIKAAIEKMHKAGIEQWGDYYPTKEVFLLDIADNALYAARIDSIIAGIVVLNEKQSPEYGSIDWADKQGKVLAVHRLCVSPVFQGQGIGRKLMNFAENYGRDNKYNSIRLDAFAKNPISVGLYESLGYQRRGFVTFRPGSISYCFEKVPGK
jgi:ribosomal protein S18 acetylase RimI-like enzyme